MYKASNDFLNAISQSTRRMDCYFEYEGNRYTPVSLSIEDNIYSSSTDYFIGTFISKNGTIKVDFSDNLNLENKYIDLYQGVYINENEVEYVPLGRYYIYEVKSNTEYQIMDSKMLFNIPFDGSIITYPITVLELLQEVCNQTGVSLSTLEFPNKDLAIPYEVFFGSEATCNNVVEAIATAACSIAHINRENELELKWFSDTNYKVGIDAQSKQIQITEKYGPINSLVLSREPQNDNVYIRDEESIEANGLTELKIVNNPILDIDRYTSRLEVFERINGFEYLPFKCELQGQIHLDSCDVVGIENKEGNFIKSHIFNHKLNYSGGIKSTLETAAQTKNQINYAAASDSDSKILKVEFEVNKQNGKIEGIVEEQTKQSNKISNLEIDVNGIKTTVEEMNYYNVIYNLNGELNHEEWVFEHEGLLPSKSLLPSPDLLPYRKDMPTFLVRDYPSLSGAELFFLVPGNATTQKAGYISGGEKYSFQCKRSTSVGRFAVYVLEYSAKGEELAKETLILDTQNNPQQYESASIELEYSTTFVKLRIETVDQDFGITELMFNRGEPKQYVKSPDDVYYYAKSEINQLADEIQLRVTKDDFESEIKLLSDEISVKVGTGEIISAINLSPEEITIKASKISLEGLVTANSYFKILTDGSMEAMHGKFSGDISASTININNKFKVDSDGTMTATGAKFSGDITGSNITGSTITVTTNLTVGNNIYVGTYTDRSTAKAMHLNDMFSVYSRNSVMNIGKYNSTSGAGLVDGTIQFRDTGAIYARATSFLRLAMNSEYIYMVDGSITASRAITTPSDKRLKKNIENVDLTELFDAINVKSFSYLNDDIKTVGVIAQDLVGVENSDVVLRDFIDYDNRSRPSGKYLSVDYNALNMAHIQVTKQLVNRIEKLERRLS